MDQVPQVSGQAKPTFLARELPRFIRVAFVCLMVAVPVIFVLRSYSAETKFTNLLYFGTNYFARTLPEVKECGLALNSPWGYDGQFYSQVATDPLLLNPHLPNALDIPAYRSTRIFLPLLAYVGGLGQPCVILQVFALLNLFFWLLLLFGMVYLLRPRTVQDYLCVFAAMMTAGVLFSVQRSLTDLPAATFAFYVASLSGSSAIAAAVMMLLTKETYLLALPAVFFSPQFKQNSRGKTALRIAIILAPLAAWYFYAHLKLGFIQQDRPNISWPLAGVIDYVGRTWPVWVQRPTSIWAIANLLSPFCLLVQVGYLLWRRDTQSAYWRMGIGFAIAYVFLSPDVFVEQLSFTRDAIPLVIAFNIGLMKERSWRFAPWFIAGNVGLYWGLWKTLEKSL